MEESTGVKYMFLGTECLFNKLNEVECVDLFMVSVSLSGLKLAFKSLKLRGREKLT